MLKHMRGKRCKRIYIIMSIYAITPKVLSPFSLRIVVCQKLDNFW